MAGVQIEFLNVYKAASKVEKNLLDICDKNKIDHLSGFDSKQAISKNLKVYKAVPDSLEYCKIKNCIILNILLH